MNTNNTKNIRYLPFIPFDQKDFLIIGSSVLIAHGVNIINNDIDVVVRGHKLDEFMSRHNRTLNNKNTYVFGIVELHYSLKDGKTFNELNKNADIIDRYSFISLEDLKEMYLSLGREKDKEKLIIIDKLINER